MAKRDYYRVLGISRDATEAQVKSAYRKLARKHHPDVNKAADAAEKFREVTEAYEVLSDSKKRKMYDQFGHTGPQGGFGGAPGAGARTYTWRGTPGQDIPFDVGDLFGGGRGGGRGFAGMSLEEVLEALGGRRSRSRRARNVRGENLEYHLTIDFLSAVRGVTASLRMQTGRGDASETLNVKIPPGVGEASRVRVRSKGAEGPAGRGDLYIVIHVREHPYFRREGDDIIVEVPIGIDEAALGAKVDVPTIDGMTTVTVPAGVGSSSKLRLRGKGVAAKGRPCGDEYVVVKIVPPKKTSERAAELLREFRKLEDFDPREKAPWK